MRLIGLVSRDTPTAMLLTDTPPAQQRRTSMSPQGVHDTLARWAGTDTKD